MSLTSQILSTTNNLIIHTTFATILTLFFSFIKIPTLILYALHTYIHPDDVNPNANPSGIRASIRRPGSSDQDNPQKPRKKKDKFEFDENKAQIFRLKLNEGQIQSRVFFKEFYTCFNFTFIALFSLLLHRFLNVDNDSGFVRNGGVIPLLLGFVGFCRVVFLIARVCFERSATKKLDKQLSFVYGVFGFVLGLVCVYGVVPNWVVEFEFEGLDGLVKFLLAAFMGCIVGFLYIPALRNARAFWVGTDQIRSNLAIISCGWLSRSILYANYLVVVFTSLLWISPFAEFLVKKNVKVKNSLEIMDLVGYIGLSRSSFDEFRLWCMLISGVLQIVALRPNVQMFLNEAVLCWYQRLHASKTPDLDYSRAKVFLHNHYICLVVVQFFVPGIMVLLLLALSQFDDASINVVPFVYNVMACSSLAKEVALFMAWWIVFVWAVLSSLILVFYRRGSLYVS